MASPFVAMAVARHVASGNTVRLGDHMTLRIVGRDLVAACQRCEVCFHVAFRSTALALAIEQCTAFMARHAHQERPS